jgi:hypothetical protein
MRTASISAVCGFLVICIVGTAGCNRNSPGGAGGANTTAVAPPHGHHHGHGPHGGHIVELDTTDYHVEVAHDDEAKGVGIYLLGPDASAEVAVPIESTTATIVVTEEDKPTEYKLTAAAPEGGAEGKSSFFAVESEPLFEILTSGQMLKDPPELRLTIDGKTYTGIIEDEHAAPPMIHSHSHGPDDTLVWQKELKEGDYEIALGHHAVTLMAGAVVEPAVQIKKNGEPVADAKVFSALLAGDGSAVLAEEVATVYEPPTEEEPAHYAQGALKIPAGTREATLRFRIVLPENSGEHTFDVPVAVQ